MGAFFWENPKTDLWSQNHMDSSLPKKRKIRKKIIYHDNGTVLLLLVEKNNNNNKLLLTVKTRRKSNMRYVWIYEMYICQFETQTFLE